MAGTTSSGNPWQYHMNPESVFGAFIDYLCTKEKQGRSTWTFKLILIHYEKEAREYMGDELYERFLAKQSKTIIEQMREKEETEQKEEAKEEAKQKETESKNEFLKAETAIINSKLEDKKEEESKPTFAERQHQERIVELEKEIIYAEQQKITFPQHAENIDKANEVRRKEIATLKGQT